MNKDYFEGVRSGRKESPDVENAFQDECARMIKELLETKGLYQNVRVNDAIFKKLPPGFVQEFRKRPVVPYSRGEGDDYRHGRRVNGTQPLGTAQDEMDARFYLPNVTLDCPRCARPNSFLSMTCSLAVCGPYPILGEDTEQVFSLVYRCSICRSAYVVFQVLRKGFKMQLTGRSVAFRPAIAKEWPKEIEGIVKDAFSAAAENDMAGAYYHLRTAAEFYLKKECGIAVEVKIDGSELCEKYNAMIDERLKSGFPSFASIYAELSAGLHSRVVTPERFTKLANDFVAHLKAKELFAQYSAD
jgi:hypothetical protein